MASIVIDSPELCSTLDQCAESMQWYFENIMQSDPSKNYVTLAFCATEDGHRPDENGNVWWYDHFQVSNSQIFEQHKSIRLMSTVKDIWSTQ